MKLESFIQVSLPLTILHNKFLYILSWRGLLERHLQCVLWLLCASKTVSSLWRGKVGTLLVPTFWTQKTQTRSHHLVRVSTTRWRDRLSATDCLRRPCSHSLLESESHTDELTLLPWASALCTQVLPRCLHLAVQQMLHILHNTSHDWSPGSPKNTLWLCFRNWHHHSGSKSSEFWALSSAHHFPVNFYLQLFCMFCQSSYRQMSLIFPHCHHLGVV